MRALLICLALVPGLAAADVFKCKNPDGSTRYTDVPCDNSAKPITVKPAMPAPPPPPPARVGAYNPSDWYYQERMRQNREEKWEALDRIRRQEEAEQNYRRRLADINRRSKERECQGLRDDIEYRERELRAGAPADEFERHKREIKATQERIKRDC